MRRPTKSVGSWEYRVGTELPVVWKCRGPVGMLDIDLFASWLNNYLKAKVSWKRDPEAFAVYAFGISWESQFVYAFSPFSMISKFLAKVEEEGVNTVPFWTTQPWFSKLVRMLIDYSIPLPKSRDTVTATEERWQPPAQERCSSGLFGIRRQLQKQRISPEAAELIMSSWRQATQEQYATYIRKWMDFCSERNIDSFTPDVRSVSDFLTKISQARCGYSAINTARSSFSCFVLTDMGKPVGTHPLVVRLLKVFFQQRPLPRNRVTVGYLSGVDFHSGNTNKQNLNLQHRPNRRELSTNTIQWSVCTREILQRYWCCRTEALSERICLVTKAFLVHLH